MVRVDDEGRTHFLADIYRYDRDRIDPPGASSLACNVRDEGPRLVLGAGDVVLYQDDAGDRYTAGQWTYVQEGGTLRRNPDGTFADPPVEVPGDVLPNAPMGGTGAQGEGGMGDGGVEP